MEPVSLDHSPTSVILSKSIKSRDGKVSKAASWSALRKICISKQNGTACNVIKDHKDETDILLLNGVFSNIDFLEVSVIDPHMVCSKIDLFCSFNFSDHRPTYKEFIVEINRNTRSGFSVLSLSQRRSLQLRIKVNHMKNIS